MSEPLPEVIALSKIDLDRSPHVRVMEDDDLIADYAEWRKNGSLLPPIDVFWDLVHSVYLVADGRHRVLAEKANQEDGILAVVRDGGERECLQFALSANSRHGLRRTKADIRLVVETALKDAEWSQYSNRLLAGLCNVGETTIRRFRKDLEPDVSDETPEKQDSNGQHESTAPHGAVESKPSKEPRKRLGRDGKMRPAEAPKEPTSKAPAKADKGGKEAISPESRKACKDAFGVLARSLKKVPDWYSDLEPQLEIIAEKMKVRWARGGKDT